MARRTFNFISIFFTRTIVDPQTPARSSERNRAGDPQRVSARCGGISERPADPLGTRKICSRQFQIEQRRP